MCVCVRERERDRKRERERERERVETVNYISDLSQPAVVIDSTHTMFLFGNLVILSEVKCLKIKNKKQNIQTLRTERQK